MDLFKRSKRTPILLFCAAIVVISIVIKWKLIGFTSYDTGILTQWYTYLQVHGFSGFGDSFANYNAPYLYLLWVLSNLPIETLTAIKLLSIAFDFLLAFSIYFFVRTFRKKDNSALYAATFSLVLPTVIFNGALWGQCDALYTALVLFALGFAVRQQSWASWIFFGLAIGFKLQAVFMLPVLAYLWFFYRKKGLSNTLSPLAAVGVFILGILPTVFVGKPIGEIVNMYKGLTSQASLTLNAPTAYQWLPNEFFSYFNGVGILVALIGAGIILWFSYQTIYRKKSKIPSLKESTILPLFLLVLIPFLLPQMHDRYFFTAEILAFVVAFILGGRWILVAIVLQATALISYAPYLFGYSNAILPFVAILQLAVVLYVGYRVFEKPLKQHAKVVNID